MNVLQNNCASSWLTIRIAYNNLVDVGHYESWNMNKDVRQVGYLPELYEDARTE